MTDKANLFNLLGIWDIDFNGMRRELRIEQEGGIQMAANEIRVSIPFREDLV